MDRRIFLSGVGKFLVLLAIPVLRSRAQSSLSASESNLITLFLGGDVMTGRGVDQVLPHPSDPTIHESYLKDARRYVELAEAVNGPISFPVDYDYIWGDALAELERMTPDIRIVNLETAVTTSDQFWPGKGINYRMHPKNVGCLSAAKIDCCALANNHVLDWGYPGLAETLSVLRKAKIMTAGAGRHRQEAEAPAIVEIPGKGRVIIFSLGHASSGVPEAWAATDERAGLDLLKDLSERMVSRIEARIARVKRSGDVVVVSIHWGSNWGYEVSAAQRRFAHKLIDTALVDIVHGHSSHHPRGVEVYNGRPILYGCGDLLNDYEGIGGYEAFRGDLALMYLVTVQAVTGQLIQMTMIPFQLQRFRLRRARLTDSEWLRETLNREGQVMGTGVELVGDGQLELRWLAGAPPLESPVRQ